MPGFISELLDAAIWEVAISVPDESFIVRFVIASPIHLLCLTIWHSHQKKKQKKKKERKKEADSGHSHTLKRPLTIQARDGKE